MSTELTNQPRFDLINSDSMLNLSKDLAKLIKEKGLSSNIQGKQFVNVEGWQFAGASLGLMPIITETTDLTRRGTEPGQVEIKYMAKCEVRNINTGQLVATGVAICSNFEHSKKRFDEYAILSMAQTRAIGKAYRNLLAWLMKAAGFEATPAEEMDFAPAEAPKKPAQTVQEVFAEIVEEEVVDIDAIMMEIAKCTKIKQLTDIYFSYRQLFDSNKDLMKILSMKKENLK
ncbi:hypothetical protein UFOVP753_42 [uncultured Caudovirales phage]|uniref:Uncharacterized protein n=1 Tax=uncultured Caudovirales phage TaxID=2100421 RepID=A0A6J7XE05_9CAUD|nr:hypothetical protein UFOVP753_42 [uncultured Caudovirales phage]